MTFVLAPHPGKPAPSGIITDGLVDFWPCQEGSGTVCANTANAGNDLNFGAPGPEWDVGRKGDDYCVRFIDTMHRTLATGDVPDADYLGPISGCAWIRVDSGFSVRQVFNKSSQNGARNSPFMFYVHGGDGYLALLRSGTNAYEIYTTANGLFPAVTWVHIGFSVADNIIGTEPKFYVSGTPYDPSDTSTSPVLTSGLGGPIRVGHREDEFQPLQGRIQELRIYKRVLSDAEFAAIASDNG